MKINLTKKSFYELVDNREVGDGIFIIKTDEDTITKMEFFKCIDGKLRVYKKLLSDIIKEYENENY